VSQLPSIEAYIAGFGLICLGLLWGFVLRTSTSKARRAILLLHALVPITVMICYGLGEVKQVHSIFCGLFFFFGVAVILSTSSPPSRHYTDSFDVLTPKQQRSMIFDSWPHERITDDSWSSDVASEGELGMNYGTTGTTVLEYRQQLLSTLQQPRSSQNLAEFANVELSQKGSYPRTEETKLSSSDKLSKSVRKPGERQMTPENRRTTDQVEWAQR